MSEAASRPRVFFGWWIVAGSFLIYFMSGGLFYSGTVFLKAILDDSGWTVGQVSGGFSLGLLIAGLAAPLWGRIADRRGPRSAFLPGVALTGILAMLLSQVTTIGSLYLLYALLMFGAAGISLIPVSVIISNWFVEKRGRAMGIAYTGVGFGSLILTPIVGLLIERLGWRSTYLLAGLSILAVLLPVVAWLKNGPEDLGLSPDGSRGVSREPPAPGEPSLPFAAAPPARADRADPGLSLRQALGTATFWGVAGIWFLVLIPLSAVTFHQVTFMATLGLSMEAASLLAGMAGGMSILGRIGFGTLTDRYSIRLVFCACYLMAAMGIGFLWSAARLGPGLLYPYVAVFGVAVGGSYALAPLFVGHLFGVRALGEIFGLLGLAAMIGGAGGPALAGYLFDRSGSYETALVLCAALTALGAVFVAFVRPPGAQAQAIAESRDSVGARSP